jgi:hypothetical protein
MGSTKIVQIIGVIVVMVLSLLAALYLFDALTIDALKENAGKVLGLAGISLVATLAVNLITGFGDNNKK